MSLSPKINARHISGKFARGWVRSDGSFIRDCGNTKYISPVDQWEFLSFTQNYSRPKVRDKENELLEKFIVLQKLEFDHRLASEYISKYGFDFKAMPAKMRKRLLGLIHYEEKSIYINLQEQDSSNCWLTLIHEIAHIKVNRHCFAFIEEMESVYRDFQSFVCKKGLVS